MELNASKSPQQLRNPDLISESGAPILELDTQKFLDGVNAAGGPPLYTLSYEEARKVLEGAQAGEILKPAVDIEDRIIQGGPTKEVSVRIFRPEGFKENLPVVIYFHGGGWVLGSKNTHERLLCELTAKTQAAFVFVNYTPSPEAQFPVPIEEGYTAALYIAKHGKELGLDSSRMAVAGDSVGGNLATAVALLAKDRADFEFAYQALFYPVTDANFETESYKQFAEGVWLTREAMKWFWDAYAPNPKDRQKVLASPLRATVNQLMHLPPTLVITDENDVLRDEGEAYAKKLTQAGVEVTAIRFEGTIHDFMMLNGLANTPATISAIALASEKIKAALQKAPVH
jgi:acetyl esterase